jgi:hypothetical protein
MRLVWMMRNSGRWHAVPSGQPRSLCGKFKASSDAEMAAGFLPALRCQRCCLLAETDWK